MAPATDSIPTRAVNGGSSLLLLFIYFLRHAYLGGRRPHLGKDLDLGHGSRAAELNGHRTTWYSQFRERGVGRTGTGDGGDGGGLGGREATAPSVSTAGLRYTRKQVHTGTPSVVHKAHFICRHSCPQLRRTHQKRKKKKKRFSFFCSW